MGTGQSGVLGLPAMYHVEVEPVCVIETAQTHPLQVEEATARGMILRTYLATAFLAQVI